MRDFLRGRLAIKYIFFEILPSFIFGILIFLFIILMFQSFRLSEYIIIHGAKITTILKILFYLAISFLPVVLPMSLLFAILLTYGRLSSDSEIVALKALGLNMRHLAVPAIILALVTSLLSAQTSFFVAPWGNRRMEVIVHQLGETKPGATIKEGVFSEGFFDLVVYANQVDSKQGLLKKVFIYDERNSSSPLTIIAREGQLIQSQEQQGNLAFLRLIQGNIHKMTDESYTKVDFETYDINLFNPTSFTEKSKTPLSYTLQDLQATLKRTDLPEKKVRLLKTEFHRRWAISLASIVFAILGVGLGTVTNRRNSKSGGFVLCLALVIGYWISYAALESMGKNGSLPIPLAVWSTNALFAMAGVYTLKRAST